MSNELIRTNLLINLFNNTECTEVIVELFKKNIKDLREFYQFGLGEEFNVDCSIIVLRAVMNNSVVVEVGKEILNCEFNEQKLTVDEIIILIAAIVSSEIDTINQYETYCKAWERCREQKFCAKMIDGAILINKLCEFYAVEVANCLAKKTLSKSNI